MDAVILAAGRGERMDGVTAPFHKPLLPVDGVPLVVRAVDAAAAHVTDVVVVVAPENAWPVSRVLGDRDVHVVIQRAPRGPGHALLTGLRACDPTTDRVLVLLGDNVLGVEDVGQVTGYDDYAVGVKHLTPDVAVRFTRWDHVERRWCERVPVTPHQVRVDGLVTCWVGPLVVAPRRVREVYDPLTSDDEWLIGPYIHLLGAGEHRHVPVDAYDVGTLNSYLNGDDR